MKSNFRKDLYKEAILGKYLDSIYKDKFKNFKVERVSDKGLQVKGIDLIISNGLGKFFIDEKAQLDYLNKTLPTFAFEISYLKDGVEKEGWLFDTSKVTHRYFLINGVMPKDKNDLSKGFVKCNIISVDRRKLIDWLNCKGLSELKIKEYNQKIRTSASNGSYNVDELEPSTEGRFYFTKLYKAEQPINIVLYLKNLIYLEIAKKII